MQKLHRQTILGGVAILLSLALFLVAIPNWVYSPSNVRKIVLSPAFWPYALAGFTMLVGVGLVLTGLRTDEVLEPEPAESPGGFRRLGIMAVIMALYMGGLPLLGMVWTSILAFAATAFLVHTRHPRTALICAVLIPLLLYAFFAHVAGVAIPQGVVVRLP